MNEFCQKEMNSYNLRIQHDFEVPFARAMYHGSESITYIGPKIWYILSASLKGSNFVKQF